MMLRKVVSVMAGVVMLSMCAGCAETGSQRAVTEVIHGVVCDPEQSTLVSEKTNENQIDDFDQLRRFKLYRTKDGRYFLQSEVGYDIRLTLLPPGQPNSDLAMASRS